MDQTHPKSEDKAGGSEQTKKRPWFNPTWFESKMSWKEARKTAREEWDEALLFDRRGMQLGRWLLVLALWSIALMQYWSQETGEWDLQLSFLIAAASLWLLRLFLIGSHSLLHWKGESVGGVFPVAVAGTFAFPVALAVTGVGAFAVASAVASAFLFAIAVASVDAFAFAFAIVVAVAVAGAVAGAFVIFFASSVAGTIAGVFASIIAGGFAFPSSVSENYPISNKRRFFGPQ